MNIPSSVPKQLLLVYWLCVKTKVKKVNTEFSKRNSDSKPLITRVIPIAIATFRTAQLYPIFFRISSMFVFDTSFHVPLKISWGLLKDLCVSGIFFSIMAHKLWSFPYWNDISYNIAKPFLSLIFSFYIFSLKSQVYHLTTR